MPTYAYECGACGHRFEEFQSMTAAPLVTCPACKKRKLQRLIGAGAGIIFKGSGFYITDYRNKGGGGGESSKGDAKAGDSSSSSGTGKSSDTPTPKTSSDSGKGGESKGAKKGGFEK